MTGDSSGKRPDAYRYEGEQATQGEAVTRMQCTECQKWFMARLDHDIDGDHVIECAWCGHEHCRQIKAGKVTDIRWSSRPQRDRIIVDKRNVWRSDALPAKTTSTSEFLSEIWTRRTPR